MKAFWTRWTHRGGLALETSTFAGLLLTTLTISAAGNGPYTATGWITEVAVPGIWHTNVLGQVLVRGNAHLVRVESSDLRVTGRRLVMVDGAAQTNGSVLLYGNCYQQVGTWDPAGTNFTPSAGLWEISYRGVMQADNSLQLHLVGSGSGGSIDGLCFEEDLTRAACSAFLSLTCSYQHTGTLKPVSSSASEIIPFESDWQTSGGGTFEVNNGQLIAIGHPSRTETIMDSYYFGWPSRTWTVPEGMTLEWRTKLASLDENATNLAIVGVGTFDGMYGFHKGRDFSYLWKWLPSHGNGVNLLACNRQTVRNTNVILALALTRAPPNLWISARVLDQSDTNKVLAQCSAVDTPDADPVLTAEEFTRLTGVHLRELIPDVPGSPLELFWAAMGVFQYTDGNQPAPQAVFDQLEVRTSEIPPVNIETAVRLSWPRSTTINYAVEAAGTLEGPWLPLGELDRPGVEQRTVPASEATRFFRLRQAP